MKIAITSLYLPSGSKIGVGYQVHCSARTLQALPAPGEAAVLSIETYVREDQIKLSGACAGECTHPARALCDSVQPERPVE